MIEMSIPKVECIGIADNYGRFKIAPLETGYGLTLGNALRRILLSSLEGAAVTSVNIIGVQHEFSTLAGVKEDVTDIILNIKRLRVKSFSDRPVTLRLDVRGPKQVTAADIRPNSEVDVVSSDVPVATLDSEDAHLQMELTVEKGRGYIPAEANDGLPLGSIAVDAIYSPVTKVNYVVERTRVGQKTDYDQLVIEVWTDGTVAPGEALSHAARILVDQSQVIAAYAQGEADLTPSSSVGVVVNPEIDSRSVDDLGLTSRTLNCLKRSHLVTVGQVLAKSKRELLSIRNFGERSLRELDERLRAFGYIPEDFPPDYLLSVNDTTPLAALLQEPAEQPAPNASENEASAEEDDEPIQQEAEPSEEYAE